MNSEKWQKLDEIFHAALEIEPAARRKSFLSRACRSDAELEREIESLLASHENSEEFLKKNALEIGAQQIFSETAPTTAMPPPNVGEYKIIQEIGRGGFGAVFLAERSAVAEDDFVQKVALKVIKRGMDTDEIVRRFRQERQVLASLNHPFITKLLDGGTTADGLPYLVMEYVEGVPLDEFCDAPSPALNERLELFRKICAAVQYAHQNLVVHRDLKPSNILITAEGVPKLLDFGVAKILSDESSGATKNATRIFTPEYASPEQQKGEKITTATDVYSLGVLLSEIVYSSKNEAQSSSKSISSFRFLPVPSWFKFQSSEREGQTGFDRERQKTKNKRRTTASPFALGRLSHAKDLEKIIQMATRTEAARRYASAGDLAEDIRRFQRGFPIAAQRDSFFYRAEKFVRRHKLGFAAAAIAIISLVSGFSVAVWQARVAGIERKKAERRYADVRALTNSFLFEFHDAIRDTAGTYEARRLVVAKALEYLKKLEADAAADAAAGENDDVALLRELSAAYNRVGDAQSNSLKENESALESFQTAAAIDRRILRLDPGDLETKKRLAANLFKCGETLTALGRAAEALQFYRDAAAIHEENLRAAPEDLGEWLSFSDQLNAVAGTLAALKQTAAAEEFFRRALQAINRRIELEKPDDAATVGVTLAWMGRGDLLKELKDWHGAAESYKKAVELAEKTLPANPSDAQALRNLSASHNRYGEVLDALGDGRGALENFKFCMELLKKKSAETPDDGQVRLAEANYTIKVAAQTEKTGDRQEALRLAREGLRLNERLTDATDASNGYSRSYQAGLQETGADLLVKLGQAAEARKTYEQALKIYSEILPAATKNAELGDRITRLRQKISAL